MKELYFFEHELEKKAAQLLLHEVKHLLDPPHKRTHHLQEFQRPHMVYRDNMARQISKR